MGLNEKLSVKTSGYMLYPDSPVRIGWDFLIFFCILY